MQVLTTSGRTINLRVGQPLTGIGVVSVTLGAEDVTDPHFDEWAKAILYTRFSSNPRCDPESFLAALKTR